MWKSSWRCVGLLRNFTCSASLQTNSSNKMKRKMTDTKIFQFIGIQRGTEEEWHQENFKSPSGRGLLCQFHIPPVNFIFGRILKLMFIEKYFWEHFYFILELCTGSNTQKIIWNLFLNKIEQNAIMKLRFYFISVEEWKPGLPALPPLFHATIKNFYV